MKNRSVTQLKQAFEKDGFKVYDFSKDPRFENITKTNKDITICSDGSIQYKGKTGLMAQHLTATKIEPGKREKKAFYVEGNNSEMGFLLGLMAEEDVYRMATDFLDNIVPAFIDKNADPKQYKKIKELIVDLLEGLSILTIAQHNDIPKKYLDEILGLYEGCVAFRKNNHKKTKYVLFTRLLALNLGIDIILAHVYTGKLFEKAQIKANELNVPIMCNAFSIKGGAIKDNKHFFGRDFMFSTADVFQDTACMTIYNSNDKGAIPTVSQTAPGFIGSITAMNLNGIAAGTDMNPTKMCNPDRPGFNSLGLVRDSVQYSSSIDDFITRIRDTQRGVSWLYPGADGQSGRACFVEAGNNIGNMPFPYFCYIDEPYKTILQKKGLTEQYITEKRIKFNNNPPVNGMIVRESNYHFPVDYMSDFNSVLFDTYNNLNPKHTVPPYKPKKFEEYGYINETTDKSLSSHYPGTDESNCPAAYYFAPQRENDKDLIIVTNGNISPEMRLTAMDNWIELLAGSGINDIQWRYDELNNELLSASKKARSSGLLIDDLTARQIIDFRAPGSPDYTVKFPKIGWEIMQIHGSVSLCELTKKIITSHYGYYGDGWVTITLPNYFT
jgi:hypothetical protein